MILRDLTDDELPAAAAVLGEGMRDNPIHVRVFGGDSTTRELALTRLFEGALTRVKEHGAIEGAFEEGRLVALCGRTPPGYCRVGFLRKLRSLPSLLRANPLPAVLKTLAWAGAWGREDPSTPHWHLGPVGVVRGHQGRGIGSALLDAFCARMDQEPSAACLETDKEVNVRFYERAGFRIVQQKDVLGVPCWFMSRKI